MAVPVIGRIAAKVFRDAKGRFISRAKHELLGRRSLITGRFLRKDAAGLERSRESEFRKILGRPPAGQEWVRIADKYPDRLGDISMQVDRAL